MAKPRAVNPFTYQHPVSAEELIDREPELEQLLSLVDGGHFVRLSGPRRYGKTTLLHRLTDEANKQLDMTALIVDFYDVLSLADVAIRIEAAYRRSLEGPVRNFVRDLFLTWNVGLSLGAGGLSAKIEANPHTDPLPALHRLLDLPGEVFKKHGKRILIVFDEFQDVLDLKGVDGIIRSHIQHDSEAAAYVFAGSEPGLMEKLFSDRERPLFGQAHPIQMRPLPDDALAFYIRERFVRTGRDVGDAIDPLIELVRGHPQRAMLLAHYVWDLVPPGEAASISTYSEALSAALAPLVDGFERFIRTLPTNEHRVLTALALSPRSLYSDYTLSRFGLPTASSARSALDSLIDRGEVVSHDGNPELVDPLLAFWLRHRRLPPNASGGDAAAE
ncbi:MAG: AAA family ATPase [Thermoleophilaceae bacterium]